MLKFISYAALVVTVVPCVAYMFGAVLQDVASALALVGTILWFAVTPLWMGRKLGPDADQVQI